MDDAGGAVIGLGTLVFIMWLVFLVIELFTAPNSYERKEAQDAYERTQKYQQDYQPYRDAAERMYGEGNY